MAAVYPAGPDPTITRFSTAGSEPADAGIVLVVDETVEGASAMAPRRNDYELSLGGPWRGWAERDPGRQNLPGIQNREDLCRLGASQGLEL